MTLFHALGPFAAQAGVVAAPGMVLLTPTSIAYSGLSASIGANGQVTFTAVTSLSLNGVFTADFDNYVVSLRHGTTGSAGSPGVDLRLRASGSDNSTASSYTRQTLNAASTSVSAARSSGDKAYIQALSAAAVGSFTGFFYGPYLAQPTAARFIANRGTDSAYIQDTAVTHNQSTAYDGFTILIESPWTFTGALQVYGVRS